MDSFWGEYAEPFKHMFTHNATLHHWMQLKGCF